ncbi:3' terminal RNA ribose 2'-O-methyltransferase Hen1 [Ornithinimicrobium sp. Y1847]|uniref:3' terminal RNA ribose 2'-O-methyltransferase Hen1 n=1 Tax=Ornithinimicrobium sp. Y1847 TaxID=3405419 RepID=UPI003B670A98
MLLTLTSTAPQAPDLGFLLYKHPDRVQTFTVSGATATVLYPEVEDERCTVALVLEVDPVALARRKGAGVAGFALGQYVNDRTYAASSLLAVAIGQVFGTALNGRCEARPELVDQRLPLTVRIPALPARAGRDGRSGMALLTALFAPLGWSVAGSTTDLAEGLEGIEWGPAPYVDVELTAEVRLADALSHLYVLLPVLDDAKHYWVGPDEVDKLMRRGEGWLAGHPEREFITRRYVGVQRDYVEDALSRLAELDEAALPGGGPVVAESAETTSVETATDSTVATEITANDTTSITTAVADAPPVPHKRARLAAVLTALREVGAQRVVDLGCGEGFYLGELIRDPTITEVVGIDVSAAELARAERRLGLTEDRLPDTQRAKLTLRQSSVTYRDDALAGYDAILLVEVVEHLEPDRVEALVTNVFGHARPRAVVLTTPNAEHNVRYGIPQGQFRHPDHRFEWTRQELASWAQDVGARHGYTVEVRPVGEDDPEVGPSTQLALFTRRDQGGQAR